jgi:hypothetical protein
MAESRARALAKLSLNDNFELATASYAVENDEGNSSTAVTIDWTISNKAKVTLTGDATLTFTAAPGPTNLVLKVVQDATGTRLVTWPGTVQWPGGVAPTLSTGVNDVDIFTFYYDGTNYFGGHGPDYS